VISGLIACLPRALTTLPCRSVGCTVIELLEGRPPYHALKPMQALYRIVQDDCPPIPEGASPIVKDFLYHCFQKDCNPRISAKKLLRHPWMLSAKKQMADGGKREVPGSSRPLSNYNFDEAVLKVQEWNEALRCELRGLSFRLWRP
jgi:serine/threonine protein kinase